MPHLTTVWPWPLIFWGQGHCMSAKFDVDSSVRFSLLLLTHRQTDTQITDATDNPASHCQQHGIGKVYLPPGGHLHCEFICRLPLSTPTIAIYCYYSDWVDLDRIYVTLVIWLLPTLVRAELKIISCMCVCVLKEEMFQLSKSKLVQM